jgi:hypothetical protein
MQQTCSRCGGLLVPGATVCNYCGQPVPSNAYPQQSATPPGWQSSSAPPPGTQYGGYTQTSMGNDPYAAQYGPVAAPPAMGGSGGYGQPSQPSPFGPPPASTFGPPPASSFGPPPSQKRSPVLLISVIVLIALVLGGLGVGAFALLGKNKNTTVNPTSTAGVTPTSVSALYQASLTSDPGSWDCTTADACAFSGDGYHIKGVKQGFISDSLLVKQTFDNAVIEVKGTILQGDPQNAGLGIEFRVPQNNKSEGYGFFVYDDGTYDVIKWDSDGKASNLIDTTSSGAIPTGLNHLNDLKIVINGSQLTFFDNGKQITAINDSSYPSGYIGLAASGVDTEAVFANLLVTKPAASA